MSRIFHNTAARVIVAQCLLNSKFLLTKFFIFYLVTNKPVCLLLAVDEGVIFLYCYRVDTTLLGFDQNSWIRGSRTYIFTGSYSYMIVEFYTLYCFRKMRENIRPPRSCFSFSSTVIWYAVSCVSLLSYWARASQLTVVLLRRWK